MLLVFGMMERPGLDLWYNFVLLYPLARFAGEKAWFDEVPAEEPQPEEAQEPQGDLDALGEY